MDGQTLAVVAGALLGLIYALQQPARTWRSVLGWTLLAVVAALVAADACGLSLDPHAVPGDHFG